MFSPWSHLRHEAMTKKIVDLHIEVLLEKIHDYAKEKEFIKLSNTIESYVWLVSLL